MITVRLNYRTACETAGEVTCKAYLKLSNAGVRQASFKCWVSHSGLLYACVEVSSVIVITFI